MTLDELFPSLHLFTRTFINAAHVTLVNFPWLALIFTQHEKNTGIILCPVGVYDAYH